MPRYRYICIKGHETELWCPVSERKDTVKCETCGKRASQVYGAQMTAPATWAEPILSDSMGVHPSQIKEAYEHSVRIGIPTEFTKDGCAIFRSRQQRRDYCRHFGVRDNNGGYGDP